MGVKRALIIYNPISGRRRGRAAAVHSMIGALEERGVKADSVATTGPNDATRLAREAADLSVDTVVAYGGDGTINEVLQGLVGSASSLAIWAGGTENVVARDLGLPRSIEPLADLISAGPTRRIALGLARPLPEIGRAPLFAGRETTDGEMDIAVLSEPSDCTPHVGSRYFLMFAGIGLDASICRGVNTKIKRRAGQLAFWLSGVQHLAYWKPAPFRLNIDGEEFDASFALIGNGKGYGGGFKMTPNARIEEPWFETYILPKLPRNVSYLEELIKLSVGGAARTRGKLVTGQAIKAYSEDDVWVEVDGEVIGRLPMSFDIVADALSIVVP